MGAATVAAEGRSRRRGGDGPVSVLGAGVVGELGLARLVAAVLVVVPGVGGGGGMALVGSRGVLGRRRGQHVEPRGAEVQAPGRGGGPVHALSCARARRGRGGVGRVRRVRRGDAADERRPARQRTRPRGAAGRLVAPAGSTCRGTASGGMCVRGRPARALRPWATSAAWRRSPARLSYFCQRRWPRVLPCLVPSTISPPNPPQPCLQCPTSHSVCHFPTTPSPGALPRSALVLVLAPAAALAPASASASAPPSPRPRPRPAA